MLAFCGLTTLSAAAPIAAPIAVPARPGAWAAIEQQFHEIPMEARRLTGPLFWLHGDDKETPERLRLFLDKVVEGGNGSFCAESRPHSDWLGPRWWTDLDVCLQHAKQNDMKMWIFDDAWWPSQTMGKRVPEQYMAKRVNAADQTVTGPVRLEEAADTADHFVALLAGRDTGDGIDGGSLVDLMPLVKDGKVAWDVPEGNWKIMRFGWEIAPVSLQNGQPTLDGASKDCVDWFMNTVYQPHQDHFKEDFGKTIIGFFYDEPETQGDWGTELNATFAARGMDWKKALVAWKFTLAGGEQTAAKYAYYDALFETWGRTLYGAMTRWCESWGGQSIGHFMEHEFLYLNHGLGAGNLFQMQKYSSMGGMDLVVGQLHPGQKRADMFQMPKMASSISHVYAKKDDITMCEIFGAYGQKLSYPEMKWLADQHQVRGVNFMITHSFNPRAPQDTDCPPYFYNEDQEPRWPLYRVWADYNNRLRLLLSGGRHVCPVAQLFCGNSKHVGKAVLPEEMSTALQDALYDSDWLPYDVFDKDVKVADRQLALHNERYRALVVPPVEAIPWETLAKVRDFFNAGGVVLAHGFLPSQSATLGKTAADIAALCSEIWGDAPAPGTDPRRTGAAGGKSYFLSEKAGPAEVAAALANAAVPPVLEVASGQTDGWLHALERVKEDATVYFVCNQDLEHGTKTFRLVAKAVGVPERWDPMRNMTEALPAAQRDNGRVEFELTLEPGESALVVFRTAVRTLPRRAAAGGVPGAASAPVNRTNPPPPAPPAGLNLEGCDWVWHPQEHGLSNAPAGTRAFKRMLDLPENAVVREARFMIAADNQFSLHVNGALTGASNGAAEAWRDPKEIDFKPGLKPGRNLLLIYATNTGPDRSPAGLIGAYRIELEDGAVIDGKIDDTWRVAPQISHNSWKVVEKAAPFGGGPWAAAGGGVPAPKADPFEGTADWAAAPDSARERVMIVMDGVKEGVRVQINGQEAGGCIGAPFMLDVTRLVKAGSNTVRIEPFAPGTVKLAVYPR
jgi:hypothetical protein